MGTDIAAADLNIVTLAKHFSDEEAAYLLVERMRWPNGPVCPHCGVGGEATYLAPKDGPRKTSTGKVSHRRIWNCNACRQLFSVLVGTIFEYAKVPLSKWLLAVHRLQAGKNGVAALELQRTLGVSYKTAWLMAHRIRYAMAQHPLVDMLQGTVEGDETDVGGVKKGKPITTARDLGIRCCNRSMTTDKQKPNQPKITLAPLSFEEALDGLLRTPPPPKEPKPKKDGGKKDE